jgi:hypothetical protein
MTPRSTSMDRPSTHNIPMPIRRIHACLEPSSLTVPRSHARRYSTCTTHTTSTQTLFHSRLLEPHLVAHSTSRRRYSSICKIRIGEWKCCTDSNPSPQHSYVHPLANTLNSNKFGTHVDMIRIVMNITCTPHIPIFTRVTLLIFPRFGPPNKSPRTTTSDTLRIISQLHIHVIQWLDHMFRIYRIKSLSLANNFTALSILSHPTNPTHDTHLTISSQG